MNQTPSPALAESAVRPDPTRRSRIAIVASGWHRDIVAQATTAMRAEFEQMPDPPDELDHFEVPGAFEIPLHAQRLARTRRYDAIIACGFVVNGGIYRHEFVAGAVIDALMRVQLETDTPVFSAVLTPRDFHEHEDHRAFFAAHFVRKGIEAAQACAQTLASLKRLPGTRVG